MPSGTRIKTIVYIEPNLKAHLEILAKTDRRSLSSFIELLCQDKVEESKAALINNELVLDRD